MMQEREHTSFSAADMDLQRSAAAITARTWYLLSRDVSLMMLCASGSFRNSLENLGNV